MSDDELEHLRAILAKTHSEPERVSILSRISRAAKRLFTRSKKNSVTEIEKKVHKKNAA
jgi:hypothetical protein